MSKHDSLSLWKQRIEEQKNSGMGIREWCEAKQLSKDAYYYWRKKIQKISVSPTDRISFMKLPMPKEKEKLTDKRGLTLQWKEFTLSVTESSCIPLLTELMKGLVEEC
ncbi:MAG: hypothetical protein IKL51_05580 [Lachnospiraceae bacterium]|nr:hypothetical protein [Lachnospiraceae bacterium]